jgi:CRISPR-associated endonuclease/helicase Cas3/CRISPR-associated endonuclease Cas3-HD
MKLDAEKPNWPELQSHPEDGGRDATPLERHLCAVAARARDLTPEGAETADGESLRDAAEIVGLAHDIGKATTYFQAHIGNGTDDGPSHHARLGGLLAYYALNARGYGPKSCFAGLVAVAKHHGTLPNATSFIEDGLDQESTWEPWEKNEGAYNGHAVEQAENIETNHPAFARAAVDRLVGSEGSWSEFQSLLVASRPGVDADRTSLRGMLRETFMRRERRWYPNTRLFKDGNAYLDELRLYGALTFADKTHAAGITSDDDRLHADPLEATQVRAYIETLGDKMETLDPESLETRLNGVRSRVQEYVDGRTEYGDPVSDFLAAESEVATLTLPTGYGKTLTGLLTAGRLREATNGDRIVYALPFTSVIDQTADVLRDVLRNGSTNSDPAIDRRFTVHHHLSESLTLSRERSEEGSEEPTDEESERAIMLAESWRAGVTLTTFVQLFESLAGPRNTQSMKLPALYGSVVVIDEPQALPLRWWPIVNRLIEGLVDEYDATVVLMTATQPRIVDEETFPLLDSETLDTLERESTGRLPNRVAYQFHPTALTTGTDPDRASVVGYGDAAESLVTELRETGGSVLAICNTIDSVGELFEFVASELSHGSDGCSNTPHDGWIDIAARFEDEIIDDSRVGVPATETPERRRAEFVRSLSREADPETPAVLFLSTRLRPCDRRFLLTVARDVTAEPVPFLVVSTQLVEAGVDVSFDRVVRDFAPLDSIVQAAGRPASSVLSP